MTKADKDRAHGRADEGASRAAGARDAAPEPPHDGHDAASYGLLLRSADVRSVRREERPHPVTKEGRRLVVADWVASTEAVDSYESILIADWDKSGGLDNFRKNPVLLWAHDRTSGASMPAIGHCENVRVENNQLRLTVVCDDTTQFDREIAEKIEKGILRAGSVGFAWEEAELRTVGDREVVVFSGNTLREFSICNVGSNPETLAQRELVSVARETARANGGRVDMRTVVTKFREQRAAQTRALPASQPAAPAPTDMRTGTTALSSGVVPAAAPHSPEPPARAAAGDTTMPTKKTIEIEERAVRATETGITCDAACPHCEAPIEVSARSLPATKKHQDEMASLTTRATTAETSLERMTAEKAAAENRATLLDSKLATAEQTIRTMREQHVASEIDARIGKKLDPTEREDQVRLALLDLADQAPDPDKAGSTLGDKAFAARLAKIDARRDIGLLGAPITAGGVDNAAATGTQSRSLVDEINQYAAAAH